LRTTPKQRGGVTGKGFLPGHSGNAGGRPKGSQTYAIRTLVAEALNDPNVWREAVERYRETLKTRKTVISGLEFAARVNREIGLGSNDEVPGRVTIIFESNIRPGALRRAHEAQLNKGAETDPPPNTRREQKRRKASQHVHAATVRAKSAAVPA